MNRHGATLNLLLIFGGRSCEHAVSVSSAQSLITGLKGSFFTLQLIGITEQGEWRWQDNDDIENLLDGKTVDPQGGVPIVPDLNASGRFLNLKIGQHIEFDYDAIFPLMHGPYSEDGTIQGLFEMFDVPYVGCGVIASACGMDKLFSKVLFANAGIPQADYVEVRNFQWQSDANSKLDEIVQSLQFPLFVKPANMGSSVGVSKVTDREGLRRGVEVALKFDPKVLVENGFENMLEVECAVLGNDFPRASVVGEIRTGGEFYDYDSKYIDDSSEVIIPAPIREHLSEKVRALALKAFKAIDGSGMARVDFFIDPQSDEVWINEINTLPGFTPISMYPKLWQASDLPYDQLIAKLVELAIERYKIKKSLECSYST